jgi:hypothetical protein
VAVGNQFAKDLLANQRQFADDVITVLSPLVPGRRELAAPTKENRPQ